MFENKLMKTVSDAAVITEITAGYRWIAKKVTKRVDNVRNRRGNVNVHRGQGIVERFNQNLGKRFFSFQYSQEMNFTSSSKRSAEGVKML